jgi:lantibiotic leader peptide-processing serine protease
VSTPVLRRALVALAAVALVLTLAATASAARYTVVFKQGRTIAGVRAVHKAGGTVLRVNKLGVATVRSSRTNFAGKLRAYRAVAGVARDASFYQRPLVASRASSDAAPPGTFPDVPTTATGCAQQYQPPGGTGVGPDPLSVCQWDMRIINASPTGSYAANRGDGATVGIIDTGVDLTHPDIAPNLSVALSCSFIRPSTPTSLPQEWETTSNCSTKSAVQDYAGHGTHVAGEVAAPINGIGVAGVAPEATIVGLKAGTAQGFFFTQEVVDALVYAGDKRLDVVNMSFFADPWLFNCKNDAEQRAIVQAISRAARFAHQRGVVLVASAGNEETNLDDPEHDVISPDYPPGSEQERDVGNQCVVLPGELPWVQTISAIGPKRKLSFYSNWGNSKVDVTAPGGSSGQAPNPFGRVLNAWSSTAPFTAGGNPTRTVEDCDPSGGCVYYAWIQGTSMASPHAAGVAAIIRSRYPTMPSSAVGAMLQNTAMPMACGGEAEADALFLLPGQEKRCTGNTNPAAHGQTNFYGNGLVDALAAATE